MRITKVKILVFFLMLSVMSSFNLVEALDNGNYYSSDLVAGTVLEWNYVLKNLHLNPITTDTSKITITVLQDVEDVTLNEGDYGAYFDYSAVSTSPISASVISATMCQLIGSYIYPIIRVIGGESFTYYEYFKQNIENPPKYEISRKGGNLVIKTRTGTGADEFTNDIKVHEDTGILREKSFYGYIDVYEIEYTIDVEFIGGLDLASGEFSSVIILFICVAIFRVIIKRKRNNQPP
ncbi:MAG: hypothetical protein KAU62_10060 [Candidatus Heimdallarchaeota archaeon]|nr:hypothetical protein [Candidatus Heimdallarchaeota archaeon]MCG3256421.1 hypothetical protein [Candidatus Heimdallarchaeota archaeon]MCK4611487.1 hypothetical protein [Candidatus Heimdallarchaeota archaeon]